jgi:Uma2 family endonuclease
MNNPIDTSIRVMISLPQPSKMTSAEYLQWEPQQDIRYEFVEGEVVAMTGGTIPHNDIALNLYTALRSHLRTRGCRINVADVKVIVNPTSTYFYPDLVVSCDRQDLTARETIASPTVIVEVLSPSTAAKDRSEKFARYRSLPSLQEYVLIEADKIGVECYRRGEGRMWLYYPYIAGDTIELESIEFSCPIELLYEGVSFENSV